MSAFLSFLGGSAFRMLWGEIATFVTKRQDHKHELELMERQAEISDRQARTNMEATRLQAELGVKTIEVQREAHADGAEVDAWLEVVKSTTKTTGIAWVDAWNQSIRPALATAAFIAVIGEIAVAGWVLTDWDRELIGAILGIYVADRSLSKRGK